MQSTLAFLLLQATSDAAEATPEITEVDVNVLQLLMEGGWYIMLPLALMSLIGMYVFFERFLAIQKADKVSPDFMNRLKDYISQGNFVAGTSYRENRTKFCSKLCLRFGRDALTPKGIGSGSKGLPLRESLRQAL